MTEAAAALARFFARMPKTVLLVFSDATEGQDAEYNSWYEDIHLPDVLKIPSMAAAQRFRLQPAPADAAQFPWTYLSLYEIDSDDVPAFQAELGKRAGTTAMPLSDALDKGSVKTLYAQAVGRRQESAQ